MKFGICNETFQDWPFDKAFAYARACGYTGIELAPFTMHKDVREISAARRDEVKRLAEQHQLEVIGLHWLLAFTEGLYLTSPEHEVRQRTSAYLEALAHLCRDVGGRVLVLGSPQQRNLLPGVTHDEALDYAAEILRAATPSFAECDVILAVEPLGPQEGNFLLTAEQGRRLVDMVDSPHCRLHLDVKAMSSESQPIEQTIRDSIDYLEHFHANDANRRGPGMGQIDFVPILRTLHNVGYDGWVSVEVFDYDPGVEALCGESIQYLQRCLAECGE